MRLAPGLACRWLSGALAVLATVTMSALVAGHRLESNAAGEIASLQPARVELQRARTSAAALRANDNLPVGLDADQDALALSILERVASLGGTPATGTVRHRLDRHAQDDSTWRLRLVLDLRISDGEALLDTLRRFERLTPRRPSHVAGCRVLRLARSADGPIGTTGLTASCAIDWWWWDA